jgi:hypothetical protein
MSKENTSAEAVYLIIKRGLYYRPQSAGYTGLKDQAGRYTLDEVAVHFPNMDSPNQDGMSFVDENEAGEYSPACPWDLRLKHKAYLDGKADAKAELKADLDRYKARAERAEEVLQRVRGWKITPEIDLFVRDTLDQIDAAPGPQPTVKPSPKPHLERRDASIRNEALAGAWTIADQNGDVETAGALQRLITEGQSNE